LLVDLGVRPRLFTLNLGAAANGEDLICARKFSSHLQCDLDELDVTPAAVAEALPKLAASLEQPFGDAALMPLYLLGKLASQSVPVVFNGEGGDQIFGGWANKPMIAAETYGAQGYCRQSAYLQTFHRFLGDTDQLYGPRLRAVAAQSDAKDWITGPLTQGGYKSLLHQLRWANLALKGAQNIAPRSMQAAEACGLRLEAPFQLPPDWLLRGACEKYLLKKAASIYLPEEVVWREKRGMGVPATEWCTGPLRGLVANYLQSDQSLRDGLFEPRFIRELMRGEDAAGEFRRRRVGEKLWTLLMGEAWRMEHNQ
jgi:asparagine synthase (glutamine-hydrolysing)